MFEIGRLAVKIAGRDAGKKCVVIDTVDKKHVLIDGETRRKKCNLKHLQPLPHIIQISKGIEHSALVVALQKIGIESRSSQPKKETSRPKKQRKDKPKQVALGKEAPSIKKSTSKESSSENPTKEKPKVQVSKEATGKSDVKT
jgi:large subunit ribosomal protein L14e